MWTNSDEQPAVFHGLSPGLNKLLSDNGWKKPEILQLSVTSLQDAEDMVRGLDPTGPEKVVTQQGTELWNWCIANEGAATQARKRQATMERSQRTVNRLECTAAAEKKRLQVQPISKTILSLCHERTQRWRTREAKLLFNASTDNARKQALALELKRWVDKFVDILIESDLPVVRLAELSSDPRAALVKVIGKRRTRTVRTRVRQWIKIRLWLQCLHRVSFPQHIGQMLDYLSDVTAGDYGKSLPAAISAALGFVEKCSGLKEGEWISTMPLWIANVGALTCEAQGSSKPIRKAPSYFLLMVISLELWICSARPLYWRGYAWIKMLKLMCSLRFDDTQGICPARLFLGRKCFRAVLTKTKTTGPGKPVLEVPIFCHRAAGFTGKPWLAEGFEIWTSQVFNFERDFFVPLPSADMEGVVKKMASYSDCSALSRDLLAQLRRPKRGLNGQWKESEEPLLPEGTALFFQEHSERNFMSSVCTANQVPSATQDYLGRWNLKGGAKDYAKTARQVVVGVQGQMCRALSSGPSQYDEEDLAEEFKLWMIKRGLGGADDEEVARTADRLQALGGTDCLEQPWPLDPAILASAAGVDDLAEEELDEAAVEKNPKKHMRDPGDDAVWLFWQSVTKHGFRRLHARDGCRYRPEDCFRYELVTEATEKADVPCFLCFPDLKRDLPSKDQDSASEGGETSGSSSTDLEDERLQVPEVDVPLGGPLEPAIPVEVQPEVQPVAWPEESWDSEE